MDQVRTKLNSMIPLTTGGIRKIMTVNGREIKGVDELMNGESYIAVGGEGKINEVAFPIILQNNNNSRQLDRQSSSSRLSNHAVPSPTPEPVEFPSRSPSPTKLGKKPVVQNKFAGQIFGTQEQKALLITCYRNGDKHHSGEKLSVHPKKIKNFDQLLLACNVVRLVTGPVRKIYTMEGKMIKEVEELQDGGRYICAGGEKVILRSS